MIHEPRFLAGLDLGKRQDYTALAILEHRRRVSGWDPVYFCQKVDWDLCMRRLVRFPLGTLPRSRRSDRTRTVFPAPLGPETPLVLDATGVGEVMYDLLRDSIQHLVPCPQFHLGAGMCDNAIPCGRVPIPIQRGTL